MKKKLIVGQKVWVIPQSNALRSESTKHPFEAIVKSVGSKLFELQHIGSHSFRLKFDLETMKEKSEYTSDYFVYGSKQEWDDMNEEVELRKQLTSLIYSMKLEGLRGMKKTYIGN